MTPDSSRLSRKAVLLDSSSAIAISSGGTEISELSAVIAPKIRCIACRRWFTASWLRAGTGH